MSAAVMLDASEATSAGHSPTILSPSSTVTNPFGAVKAALLQWDSQLRLSPAQLSALAAFQQQLPSTSSHSTLKGTANKDEGVTNEGESKINAEDGEDESAPRSSSSSLLSRVVSSSPLPPPSSLPVSFSHSACQHMLLSSYLTSSSSSTSFTSSYQLLCSSSSHLHALLSLSSSLLQRVSLLHHHQSLVLGQTNKVREECTALLEQQKELLAKAQRYADNLEYFTAADRIQQQLQHTLTITSSSTSSTSLDAAAFPSLLSTIDRCTGYLQANSSFFASSQYLQRYERLKERLMRLLRMAATERLAEAEKTVRAERERERRSSRGDATQSPSSASSSLSSASPQSAWLRSFVHHRALAPELAPLLRDLEMRAADDGEKGLYSVTLQEVQQVYAQQRHRLVFADLSQYVQELSRSMELTGLTRSAVSALTTLCSLEAQLFEQLFTSTSASLLSSLLSSLASILYTALRPVIIKQTSIDALCEVIIILKEETVSDAEASKEPSSTASEAYRAVLRRLIHDSQERLSYRASVLIREDIGGYVHKEEDTNWRVRMAKGDEARREKREARMKKKVEEGVGSGGGKEEKKVDDADDGGDEDGAAVSEWHHPVLELTLLTLSKLYRCLEPSVFRLLAQEAVQQCTAQLLSCARIIAATPAATPNSPSSLPSASPPLHSTLFLIRHLLTLRSQLSPFPLDFSSSHKQLDFSHMQAILPTLFSSSAKFSSFADLLQLSTPRVSEVKTDSKRSIDREVKQACERCIALMTQQLIGPLITFFARQAERQKQGKTGDTAQFSSDLRAILTALVRRGQGVEGGVAERLADLRRVVHLYLGNAVTERSLFAPVQRSLTEMMEQLRFFVSTHLNPTAAAGASQEDVDSAQAMQASIAQLDQVVKRFEQ